MNHRRTGKIARLPEAVRNEVNELIADGIDYPHIIDHLTQLGFPGFSAQNLSNWKDGNSLAKLTREVVGLERFRAEQSDRAEREAQRNPQNLGGISEDTIEKMLAALRIRYPDAFDRAAQSTLPAPEPHPSS